MKRSHALMRHNRARKPATAVLAIAAMLGTALAPVGALDAATPAAATGDSALVLSVGGARVVNLPSKMSDVVIADPNVVDVHVRSETQLYIIAKAAGESRVFVTAPNGRILYSNLVRVGNNLSGIPQMLKLAMPDADIGVTPMNGMILLTGTVKAPEDAAEAERLVQAFVGKDVTILSRLRTATPLQVNLQVKIAEVSRNLIHEVGMNLSAIGDGTGSFSGYIGHANRPFFTQGGGTSPADPLIRFNQPSDGSTTLGFVARMFGMDVIGALDLAENTGLATLLAQPNLTSLSGETASFLAGGEYPYTISNGTQGNSIEFKQYGVQLAFTPTVLSDGRVSLRVRPTVSSLDFSINSAVPALKSRTAETTVELGSGQAFMIAGLLSNDTGNNITKTPGLGNIPILGTLFKSRQFLRNETELVIVVTPYLVKPMNATDVRLPTDGFRNATEIQGAKDQMNSDGISGDRRPVPTLNPAAPADPASPQAPQTLSAIPAQAPKVRQKSANAGAAAPGFSF